MDLVTAFAHEGREPISLPVLPDEVPADAEWRVEHRFQVFDTGVNETVDQVGWHAMWQVPRAIADGQTFLIWRGCDAWTRHRLAEQPAVPANVLPAWPSSAPNARMVAYR